MDFWPSKLRMEMPKSFYWRNIYADPSPLHFYVDCDVFVTDRRASFGEKRADD
jgi:hypothetical protein